MTVRRLALVAAVGPVLFWVVVAIVTSLEWNFLESLGWRPNGPSHVPYPSSTALGQWGWLQILNFGQAGVALIALASGLWRSVRARIGTAFVFLAGVAVLASMFKTDPSNGQPMTWHGWIHALAFVLLIVSSILGILFLAFQLRNDERWRWIGFAGLALIVLAIAVSAIGPRLFSSLPFGSIHALVLLFAWYELLALRLLSLSP